MNKDHDTRIRHLKKKSGDLLSRGHLPGDLVALILAVADLQLAALPQAAFGEPGDPADQQRHEQGLPLLPRERFRPDQDQAGELLRAILDLAVKTPGPLGEAARAFEQKHLPGLDINEAVTAYLQADEPYFARWAEATPGAPRLVNFLVQGAVWPSIVAQGQNLAPLHDGSKPWRHGHCPVCGSLPFMSGLRGKEGERHCTCSFCLTDYRVPRLTCPFCGENDHKKLVFYDAPDEPGYRIDACQTCRNYIKTTDFRNLDKTSVPALDDLESLHMDILAQQRSFLRPTLSAWGF
ncbi:MAG: formate dehydrogenase accessory protein FdhE [Desulfovibrionaceae bacterium]